MFGRFVVNNRDFGNYNPHLPDRQLGGVSNATTIQNNKRSITFKITSTEDMKEFLDIVDKNKTKLESLLDKVPFTLSAFFPEVEYTPELVQKLRPLIKN
jgi:chemotaxis methyl-accepting protein methylase